MNEKTIISDADYYIRRSKSETARKYDKIAFTLIGTGFFSAVFSMIITKAANTIHSKNSDKPDNKIRLDEPPILH